MGRLPLFFFFGQVRYIEDANGPMEEGSEAEDSATSVLLEAVDSELSLAMGITSDQYMAADGNGEDDKPPCAD